MELLICGLRKGNSRKRSKIKWSKVPKDPFENLRKTMLALREASKPIIEIQNKMSETMKPLVQLSKTIQKQMEPFQKQMEYFHKQMEPLQKLGNLITEHVKQLKLNFSEAISIIEPPEVYDPSKTELHDGIHKMALDMVVFADDMGKHEFCYLQERMLIGIDAHLNENYHLSLFCIFSAIDGMLTWFYFQKHPRIPYPNSDKKLEAFFEIYNFEHVIGEKEIRPKFENFFMHRNEIMHGGKNSHFDKNLSTTALLFLGLVYSSLTAKKD